MSNDQLTMKILNMIKSQRISKEEGVQLLERLSKANRENNTRTFDERYQAVILQKPGIYQDLEVQPMDDREPSPNEVQILVKAFPINFSDFLLIKGLYPMMPDYPFTPGVEVSGVIRKIGKNVTRVKIGDEVIGVMRLECGGQASLVMTDENLVVKKPSNITHEEACGFPAAFLSMYIAFEKAQVKPGDKIFIPTATGTNALIAVQLAQYIGAEIYATAGSQPKLDFLRERGIQHLINYQQEDLEEKILEMTDGVGVDVVINTSGEGIQKGLKILGPEGRYVEIAVFGLQSSGKLDLSNLVNNQSFFSFNVKKFMNLHPEKRCHYLDIMAACLEKGIVKPHIAEILPFSQIKKAYEIKNNRSTIGRVIVNFPHAEYIPSVDESKEKDEHGNGASLFYWNRTTFNEEKGKEQQLVKDKLANHSKEDIAIVGISGRFADANNVEQFWENLVAGKNSIIDIPKERWDNTPHFDRDHQKWDKTNNNWGGFMSNVDLFDSLFFNISGHEAEQMDPQQRVFLEESWRALEDAGYATEKVSNKRCGVFVGVAKGDYVDKMREHGMPTGAQTFWGNESSILASRISYHLNLKGPAIAIDTACSSSLVSIHLACESLRSGDCEMALAGGVFIYTTPNFIKVASSAGMLSLDGQCKTFDNRANGFVPGEAVGVLVLKPLTAAERDGDQIYGVIKGSKINQDGKTNGITAPSSTSQTEVEVALYEEFGIHPESIQYIEAHGTGTKLGDPIEIEALTNAFRKYTNRLQFCGIGSVKTNIGHTAAAAGVTSMIKLLLAMKHRQIPASLNFIQPNEYIDFDNSPFFVNNKLREWTVDNSIPRRAAVSSFGFSGTNAHVVLEEYIPNRPKIQKKASYYPIPLSAKTDTALVQKMNDLMNWLEGQGQEVQMEDICYTLSSRRSHFEERIALVVQNKKELLHLLKENVISFKLFQQTRSNEVNKPSENSTSKLKLMEELRKHDLPIEYEKSLMDQLVASYLSGEDIEWDRIYQYSNAQVISLPAYPFEGIHYWIPENTELDIITSSKNTSSDVTNEWHRPLLRNTSTFAVQRYSVDLDPNAYYLTEHMVNGEKILPGAYYIEWIFTAGELAGERKVSLIQDLVWLRPLKVETAPVEIHIVLQQVGEDVSFQVYSGDESNRVIHCEGYLVYDDDPEEDEMINIEDLTLRFDLSFHSNEIYERFLQLGFQYGGHFQPIQSLYLHQNGDEVLARLELPTMMETHNLGYRIHPILLDGALQTVIGLLSEEPSRLFLPIEVGEVEQIRHLPSTVYVHTVLVEEEQDQKYFDVYIYNTQGKLLVVLSDFTIQALQSAGRSVIYE